MRNEKILFLIMSLLFFYNLQAALVTHLKFENDFEDNYGDNNGSNMPSPHDVSYTTGIQGKGIYFDGNDYLEIGKGDFDPRGAENSYSISLWVKSTEAASSSNANSYIGKHNSTGGTNVFLFGYWNNQLSVRVRGNVQYISAAGNEPVNTWVHYVVTAKESGTSTLAKVYKDGAQIWSGTITDVMGTYSANDLPWVLGQDWDSGLAKSDWFKGYMDNVRFYDNELDAAYVRQIFLKESSYVHLKFDDDFNDSIGSNHGTQAGGVLFEKGMENRSAWLDGYDDYIEFGNSTTDPRLTNGVYKDFSMSIWVKSHSPATTTNNNCYIGKHTGTGGNLFLFGYWSGALKIQIKNQVATVTTVAEPTSWTHYAISGYEHSTTNTTTMKVFKNGEQIWEGTLNDTMGSFSSTKPWVLGMDWDSSTSKTDHFAGNIDNFRFYKRRLNATYSDEVQQLYLSEFSGLRYCNTTQYAAGCTTTTETDLNLSQKIWWVYNGLFFLQVPHTSIESTKVSEGWEAYLCTSTNSQGTCHYFDDGIYASGSGLPSELLNSTYSITVQPKTFDAAKKYYGHKKVGESGYLPVGFAYFYQYANYAKPTKANDRRRLFMDSENRKDYQNMSNTILGAYRATSAELYGNVYAILLDNSYNDKYLMTSHRDFALNLGAYSALDFRNYDDNVKQIYLVGGYQDVGSVGWFNANDCGQDVDSVCLSGTNTNLYHGDELRIECVKYNQNYYAFQSGVTDDEFYDRLYDGNKKKIEQYADNYNLLMLHAHGDFSNGTYPEASLAIPYNGYGKYIHFSANESRSYSKKLGNLNTKWVQTISCRTMGEDGNGWEDPWNSVGDAYYNVLRRLNGVGGFRNEMWTNTGIYETWTYEDYWNYLLRSNMTISQAWVTAWSEDGSFWNWEYWCWEERDARFLTLENCNCTQTGCTSYMKNDYFFNVQTGPMAQKTTTTGYNYYCFRDREAPNFSNYVRTLNKSNPEETYPEEFSSYSIEPVADSIIEELMGIKIGGKETRAKGENDYSYRDDYLIMKKSGKNFSAIMNRVQESFRYENDWEYEAEDRFEEAKAIAETLTTLDLEYAGISKDTNEAFEVGGNGESLGKNVNSISFVFSPKINGNFIYGENISIEYDAQGLYRIISKVPHSIALSRTGKIMSEEKAVEDLSKSVTIEEANKGIIVYSLDENNELVLSIIARNEEQKTIKTVPLEEKK